MYVYIKMEQVPFIILFVFYLILKYIQNIHNQRLCNQIIFICTQKFLDVLGWNDKWSF